MADATLIPDIEIQRWRFRTRLLTALALATLAVGALGLFLLQYLPHRQVNELVDVLTVGIGVVVAAGGAIWATNQWQAIPGYQATWRGRLILACTRHTMAILQLVAMAAVILAIYLRLLGHPLPRL